MADFQLFIHDCPDDQAPALMDAIVTADPALHVGWEGPYAERGALNIGVPYTARGTYLDAASDVAEHLIAHAPGAWFTAWTDPDEDGLGEMVRYVPSLGRHDAECDAEGQAVFREQEITQWVISGKSIDDLTGARWTQAILGSTDQRVITYTVDDDA